MGSKNVWIGLTRMMWGFDILPGLDADGKPIPLSPYNCTNGITWYVLNPRPARRTKCSK